MKIILSLILILITSISYAKCDYIVEKTYYTSCFNIETKNSDWIFYRLDKTSINTNNPNGRKGFDFHYDIKLPYSIQTNPKEFYSSGLDKGHILANANMDFNDTAQNDTFSMLNIAPQYPKINRIIYKKLEDYERKIVNKYGHVYSYSGNIYEKPYKRLNVKSQTIIPNKLYKIIYVKDKFLEVYIIDNIPNPVDLNYIHYQSDLTTLKKLTDTDFNLFK